MRVVLLAGEHSGDLLGAEIVCALLALAPETECLGMTGPHMRAAGCQSIADIDELSLMGLFEVLRELPRLLRLRRQLRDRILALAPDVVVGIDAPDFNLGLERMLREAGLPTVHVVSPTIWAWRPKRRFRIARSSDAVLCLYPFEPACYADTTVRAEYIGHPLADALDDRVPTTQARSELGLDPEAPVLGVLPGSRRSEVERLMPDFARAAALLAERHPGITAVVAVAQPSLRDAITAHAQPAPGLHWQLIDGDSRTVMRASDLLLLASGTVTLEALLLGRAMVVGYRTGAATAWLLRTLNLLKTQHVALPNILTTQPMVPELLQEALTPAALAEALDPLWRNPDARAEQVREFRKVRSELARNAGHRAALVIRELASA